MQDNADSDSVLHHKHFYDGKTIVTIARDDDAQYNSSNILLEFKTAGKAIKMLDEDMSLRFKFSLLHLATVRN